MRDTLIIGIACVAAILLGAWLYFSGVDASKSPAADSNGFSLLEQGNFSGSLTERKNYRIKNQEEFSALWEMIHGTGAPTTIDFSKQEVIAVLDGTHTTGGYGISITSINDDTGTRVVSITHTEPGASCFTTDGITSPYIIVVVPKSGLPLSHIDVTETIDCH